MVRAEGGGFWSRSCLLRLELERGLKKFEHSSSATAIAGSING